ncbi:MAG: IS200/IS605 family transposase [Kiritimatiellae bacterium]|nr:IS200/IS605 family transposase [Kiritimatiellia bacterium]
MSYIKNIHHMIFSTKNREPLITSIIRNDLYAYLGGIIREKNSQSIEIGGAFDHVHILVMIHQSISVADLVWEMKSASTRWINENKKITGYFSWQNKYASFSVSQSMVPKVREYIRNQVEHHSTKSFMEEFKSFLDAHELKYDEKYLGE